ncbi:MAG: hypothetical protein IPK00_15970 [Deltaproteobacteria bacterium]|nr:hypothetical protein [Deltaproteobacteria bacterium]
MGFHAVQEALRAGRRRLDRLLVRDARDRGDEVRLVELARSAGVPVVGRGPGARAHRRARSPDPGRGAPGRADPGLSLEALIERSARGPQRSRAPAAASSCSTGSRIRRTWGRSPGWPSPPDVSGWS